VEDSIEIPVQVNGKLRDRIVIAADATNAQIEAAALASPIEHVTAQLPPVMLLHGDADKVVPVSASRRYEERVRAVGGRVDLHVFAGLPHGFGNHPEIRPMMMVMIGGFFRRTIVQPEAFVIAAPQAQPAAAALVSEGEAYAQDLEEEGIHSPELLSCFNMKTGIAAARAAVMQAPNGYGLCVLCALLAACMVNIAQLALSATAGNTPAAVACLALPSLFSVFLWAGFVASVKDGVFERKMGIERMFYNAGIHFLRFTATSVMVAPIAIGLALGGNAAIEALWGPALFIGRVGIVALAFAAGLFALELLLMPPVISVLEHRSALSSLTRGLLFGLRHSWDLVKIAAASMVLFWVAAGAIYLIGWVFNLLLASALPAWLFDAAKQFLGGLLGAALMAQVVASLMFLYLSHVGDEERLQDIRDKLCGPAAVPLRLYGTIAAAAVALLALSCFRAH